MKYAIVEISGRQFWVEIGKYYNLNKISLNTGSQISLNRILFLNNNGKIFIGKPYLTSAQINGRVYNHLKTKKKIVYKMQPKKKTRKKQGHRQQATKIYIENIILN